MNVMLMASHKKVKLVLIISASFLWVDNGGFGILFYFFFRTSTAEISAHKNAPNLFKKVSAPTSGTKWHNEPGDKKWYEAKTDEGHTYYWHLETHGKNFLNMFMD